MTERRYKPTAPSPRSLRMAEILWVVGVIVCVTGPIWGRWIIERHRAEETTP